MNLLTCYYSFYCMSIYLESVQFVIKINVLCLQGINLSILNIVVLSALLRFLNNITKNNMN